MVGSATTTHRCGLATVVMVHVPTAEAPILLHIGTKQPRIAHYVQQYGGQPTILVGTIAYNSRHAEPAGSFPPKPEIADQLGLRHLPAPTLRIKDSDKPTVNLSTPPRHNHTPCCRLGPPNRAACTNKLHWLPLQGASHQTQREPLHRNFPAGTPCGVALPDRQLCHPRACEPGNCDSTTGSMDQP